MSALESHDDLDEVQLLNDILGADENYAIEEDSTEYETKDASTNHDIEEFNDTLDLNKQLICLWLEFRKHVNHALQKCERKLTVVESSLQNHSANSAKVLLCNAGMPYFRDRSFFSPPNNEDELLKESQGQLQVDGLPKVSSWTSKDRQTLLKAIHQEAISDVLNSRQQTEVVKTTRRKDGAGKDFLPKNFHEMVGPLGARKFDWFNISNTHFEDKHPPIDCQVMWNVFLHPSINKKCWKKQETTKLKQLAAKRNYQNWDAVAQELGTSRTAYQCFIRYNTTKKLPKVTTCVWELSEDRKLLKLVDLFKIGDFVPWGEVASWIPNRTKQQIYFRWMYSLTPNLVKGRFTKTEDNILRQGVMKYGKNFGKISAALMPNRSAIQLNDHYQRLMSKAIFKSNTWTVAEDAKLLELYEDVGPNWSEIARAFKRKDRTQLRHRYSSLQKYTNRGIAVNQVHKDEEESQNEDESETEPDTSEPVVPEDESTDDLGNDQDFTDDVDKQLIEYFRTSRQPEIFHHSQKPYSSDQLGYNTVRLYDILELLNATLNIPDDADSLALNERDKQLLCSLKNYRKIKDDANRKSKILETCSFHMFGPNSDKETPHFVPPLPFDSKVRSRKFGKTAVIDYRLNKSARFLIERPTSIETPEIVISFIGGNEQDLQFQKLYRLLQCNNYQRINRLVVQKLYILPAKVLQENSKVQLQEIMRKEIVSPFTLSEEIPYTMQVPYTETSAATEKPMATIEPSHASLSGFKNLMYFKRLLNNDHRTDEKFDNETNAETRRSEEAENLLEARLERLFKYPIGLSKTKLPNFYGTDSLFLYEDNNRKRKTRPIKLKPTGPRKKRKVEKDRCKHQNTI